MTGFLAIDPQFAIHFGAALLVMSLLLAFLAVADYRHKRRTDRLIQNQRHHVMLSEAHRLGKRLAAEREWGRAA